jgi:hypothetical protein
MVAIMSRYRICIYICGQWDEPNIHSIQEGSSFLPLVARVWWWNFLGFRFLKFYLCFLCSHHVLICSQWCSSGFQWVSHDVVPPRVLLFPIAPHFIIPYLLCPKFSHLHLYIGSNFNWMELIQFPKLNPNTLNFELNSNLIIELSFNWKKNGMQIDGIKY